MKVHNTYYSDDTELKLFIEQNHIQNHDNILLQIFTGVCDKIYINRLIQKLKTIIPHVKILGSTTDGEICEEQVTQSKTVLSFMLFESTQIITSSAKGKTSKEIAKNLIQSFDKADEINLLITFADGLGINGEEYIKIFNQFNPELTVAGGLAGDNGAFKQTYIFTEEGCFDKDAVGAAFYNPDLIINTDYNFGWENIGKVMTVTDAKDNIVYTIDNLNAQTVYGKYLGKEVMDRLPATGVEFPLIIKRSDMDIARAVLSVNKEDGSLTFAGNIQIGDKVQFGYGNVSSIIHDNKNRYINLDNKPTEAVFVYSCMARRRLIGPSISVELEPLTSLSPLSGFFTYGELYHNKERKRNELLNESMTILTLSENQTECKNIRHTESSCEQNISYTVRALSNLVSVTSHELQELNESLEEKVKKQVQVIEQKQSQLIQQSRHASIGEMIGMIAHQWRQPLAAISGSTGLLSLDLIMDNLDKKEFQKQVDLISKQSQFLSTTIDDFRNFFKENKEKSVTTLREVVEDTLTIIRPSIESKEITINQVYHCHSKILTYPNELKQVVLNLVKNSVDILLEKEIRNPSIWIEVYKEGIDCCLELSDNGGGIKEKHIKSVFDPYFTTKEKRDGTGLGLYMSKTIIEEHCEGTIAVKNGDLGAVFIIKLVS
jgi:signal transduction histidine kinase